MSREGLSLSAEYLVASDLSKLGYPVSTAAAGLPYDLIVDICGVLYKVQVKSTGVPDKKRDRYIFKVNDRKPGGYSRESFDIIAFVATDISLVGYMSYGEIAGASKINLRGPDTQVTRKSVKAYGLHDLPFSEALNKAKQAKTFSLDEELTKAFGAKNG